MDKLVLIDGNSIANRAFYGIMSSKMMMAKDGTYTNAIYGFLSILFKIIEEVKPKYLAVAFDLKAPTRRHIAYPEYKGTRKGMPEELKMQMPILKKILKSMNIDVIEKEGYEADDILGTLAKYGEKQGLDVIILSGDRDTFQLVSNNIMVKIPRTKGGKTEVEEYTTEKISEEYNLTPEQLIDVKGLQGDASDNIPGVPGIGEKSALSLIQKYGSIENLYTLLEKEQTDLKGKQKENIENNKEQAMLSKSLGTIDLDVPLENNLDTLKVEKWNEEEVLEIFKELNLKKYIQKFELGEVEEEPKEVSKVQKIKVEEIVPKEVNSAMERHKEVAIYLETVEVLDEGKIIKEKITGIYLRASNNVYSIRFDEKSSEDVMAVKTFFENDKIKKIGIDMGKMYVLLKQIGIDIKNIYYDIAVAQYLVDQTISKINLEKLVSKYLNIELVEITKKTSKQISMFEETMEVDEQEQRKTTKLNTDKVKYIYQIKEETMKILKKDDTLKLFKEIEMPTVEVLANMQWNGIAVDAEILRGFGEELSKKIQILTNEICEEAGEKFNVNSTKQLGEILFEKMNLPVIKKTKSGYSTDVEVLEKLKIHSPIIEKILEYRHIAKLNSTYAEGLQQYINPKTKRIHSCFNQTITATGRISSSEPNLQNIPVRTLLGKKIREAFVAKEGSTYVDADYSQVELRVLAHIAQDTHMIEAFNNGEDIHKQAAAKVFKVSEDEVTSQQRSNAKAVNFGIVYGISDFGLAEQLGVNRAVAKEYIQDYLNIYTGIKTFMKDIVVEAKQEGYVKTVFGRRRYVEEIKSTNFNMRQFGERIAMNTPIQGTAADIMKIAMINIYKEITKKKLEAKIVLQVHDEVILEVPGDEKDIVEKIVKEQMESVIKMEVPLVADVSSANSWDGCK